MEKCDDRLSATIHQRLKDQGIGHMVTVANSETLALVSRFKADPECMVIDACREGEAVAIATGLVLGGKPAAVSMECTGIFESGESLRGLAVVMDIPLVLIVGYFGKRYPGWIDLYEGLGEMQRNVEIGSDWTEAILQAMDIPFFPLDSFDEIGNVDLAIQRANERSGPVALLVGMLGD